MEKKIQPIGTQKIPEGDLDIEISAEKEMCDRRDKYVKEVLGKKR